MKKNFSKDDFEKILKAKIQNKIWDSVELYNRIAVRDKYY